MTLIVGLSGRKGSGKTTLGHHLQASLPGVTLYNFADPLKRFLIDVFGFEDSWCYGTEAEKNTPTHIRWEDLPFLPYGHYPPKQLPELKNGPMTAREVMQHFGTGVVRRMDPGAWVRGLLSLVERESPPVAVVCDVRYPNEADGIKARLGKVVRLTRNSDGPDTHASEVALDQYPGFDLVLDNAGQTVGETAKQLERAVRGWLK